jgi:hypothetical protein
VTRAESTEPFQSHSDTPPPSRKGPRQITHRRPEQAERLQGVGLAGAVGADEDVERLEGKVDAVRAEGEEALELEVLEEAAV